MESGEYDIIINEKNNSNKKVGSPAFIIMITAVITFFVTVFALYNINGGVLFVGATKYGDLRKVYGVSEVIDNVDKNYYPYNDNLPTDEEMSITAMKAIVDSLDDKYANYFTADEYESYNRDLQSSFKGVGISIQIPDSIGSRIAIVYEDSPAEAAGLLVDDIITAVNGISVANRELDFVTSLIGGEDGEAVVFSILRGTKSLEITAHYGDVHVPTINSKIIDGHIGYIYIAQFADKTAEEFETTFAELQKDNIDSLIIDVRNNPGGYLTAVIEIADEILEEGVIVHVGNTMQDPKLEKFTAQKGGIDLPIVLLVNENSASASEILASAIKENDAGLLIGNTTYGKGIVQTTGKLYSTDGYLKLTTSGYYTPKGNNIHGTGVTPDIKVQMSEELQNDIGSNTHNDETDTQLQKAISWLNGDK